MTPSAELLNQMTAHALEEFPSECCGFILKSPSGDAKVVRMKNVQDDYHRRFPDEFTRTAKTAYWMDPAALLDLQKNLRLQGDRILAIYHSHPDGSAEFSAEDSRQALWGREPVFPDVAYLVLSVQRNALIQSAFYRWNPGQRAFLPCANL